ncbi:hypothetical protein C2U70_00500 [Bradyrhizobium guangdongense]|nr:hypothetical protein C2U70_00500 [Bradyrhizobium guangdongense]
MRLLSFEKNRNLSVETLNILDFYLLYPFLLHRASMPQEIRRVFRSLHIERPTDQFVQLPSEKSLFRDIAVFQKVAGTNLVAKGLLSREQYLSGTACLQIDEMPDSLHATLRETNSREGAFMSFLVDEFGTIELEGSRGLRALTGLVRRQP